ncbi:MAG TPA: glycoside hydrolase family 3 C-terminal domain-containing protein [Thermoleophilaceae bacterium]|jgi:beta-glucosidase
MRRGVLCFAAVLAAAVVLVVPAGVSAAGRCGDHPWCDTSLSPDQRAQLLLAALTPAERIGLLGGDERTGVQGREHAHTGTSDGIARVGLPPTYYSDGPVGPRQGPVTALPIPMALAATFDPRLARAHGAVVANEAKLKGNDVVFAPTVNIMRTPLNGRTFEGYGEDPYLVSRLAVGWIRGAQAQGVIANVKHFAANNQEGYLGPAANESRPGQPVGPPPVEGNRMLQNSVVDERTLREMYLPQFEAAVREAKVGSVMCSYNRLNGPYACENRRLLIDILRGEWGFRGYVLADYGAVHDTAASLNEGLDFEPWPGVLYGPLNVQLALTTAQATQQQVDEHVRRILRTAFAYGFFDRAAFVDDTAQIDQAAHARTARRIEQSAATLLVNRRRMLPLRPRRLKSIAVIGRDAAEFKSGGGSGAVTPFAFHSPFDAIAARAGRRVRTRYDDGTDAERAAALAKGSTVAIVFAGDYQTEGVDRYCLTLECPDFHGDQDALIERIAAANPRTIVVLETGGPVLTPWRGKVRALLEAWYPGQEAGPALARVLFGDVDPGGRLPVTFPRSEADLPTAGDPEKYPGVAEQVHYKEGVFVGYRWYDQRRLRPAFPFGFGRSYTRFAFRGLRVRRTGRHSARVSAVVVNRGRRRGTAVPQLYLGLPSPSGAVRQPPRQLRGVRKLSLRRGARRRVTFRVGSRALSYWDVTAGRWRVARGCYRVMVGSSSRALPLRGRFGIGRRCGR